MARSFLFIAAILLALGAASCSAQKPKPPPPAVIRTATMDITPGIVVLARVQMPPGFIPIAEQRPMWLEEGKEIAVAGVQNDRTVILGFSGPGWAQMRVLAQDGGVGGKSARIVDAAAGPDGLELALATIDPERKQAAVIVRDLLSGGEGHPVATFNGDFDLASIAWVARFTIALALRARHSQAPSSVASAVPTAAEAPGTTPAPSAEGVYLVGISGAVLAQYLKLDCKLSTLAWDPKGEFAVGQGDSVTPPILVDRAHSKCQSLTARAPIQVLGWTADSAYFLYREIEPDGDSAVFAYNMARHSNRLVAVSSGAAAFVDHKVLALGNAALSFQRAARFPQQTTHAELAMVDPHSDAIDLQQLGFLSTPAMFARSTMTVSRQNHAAAIVTYSPAAGGPMRKLVAYSVPAKSAFMVAFGSAAGAITVSWSPRGRYLAIADSAGMESVLTVIKPFS